MSPLTTPCPCPLTLYTQLSPKPNPCTLCLPLAYVLFQAPAVIHSTSSLGRWTHQHPHPPGTLLQHSAVLQPPRRALILRHPHRHPAGQRLPLSSASSALITIVPIDAACRYHGCLQQKVRASKHLSFSLLMTKSRNPPHKLLLPLLLSRLSLALLCPACTATLT
jgi:hypothetical protein